MILASFTTRRYNRQIILTITTLFLLLLSSSSWAVSGSPELIQQLKETGQLQSIVDRLAEARAKGVCQPDAHVSLSRDGVPRALNFDPNAVDTFRVLVILCDFSDNTAAGGTIFAQNSDFEQLLFSYNEIDNHYSMAEFYLDNSYGDFFMEGVVVGWVRLPQTYAYYVDGNNGFNSYPTNAQKMAEDALLLADPLVDYSQFDGDGNGWMDGVFIVHAGPGAEQSGSTEQIWSHKWSLNGSLNLDGINISSYTTEPEEDLGAGLSTMGVYAHEYGHFLGLPDLYDTDYSSSGCGRWSLMAGGSWTQGGRYPSHMDAWCKDQVGFLTLQNITSNVTDVDIPMVQHDPVAFRLWENGDVGPQYFIIENRRSSGKEFGIPGSGLLIYHVDENQWGNSDETHYLVGVEQSDGNFQLEAGSNSGDAGDPWTTDNVGHFDDLTIPNTRKYSGVQTKTSVWNISPPDSIMTASFDINYSRPRFELQSGTFSDADFGNNNGIPEAGEMITYVFSLQNLWLTGGNVTGTLSADNNDIIFNTPSVNIGTVIGNGGVGDNIGVPITFTIPADFTPCIDSFYFEVTSDVNGGDALFGLELHIGAPTVLLVDDDNGGQWQQDIEAQLFNMRLPFDVHNKLTSGSPTGAQLSNYETVIWTTGDARSNIISAADIAAMKTFMDGAGSFFLTGQSIVDELNIDDQSFLNNYLHSTFVSSILYPFMNGVAGSRVGDGLKIRYDSFTNQTDPQRMDTIGGSFPEVVLPIGGATMISYEGSHKSVLMSFGFEGVSPNFVEFGYSTPDTVFARIINFLIEDTSSINPEITTLQLEGESSQMNILNHIPTFAWSSIDTTGQPVIEYEVIVGTGDLCYNRDNMWSTGILAGADTQITYAGLPLVDGEIYVVNVRVNNGITWSGWQPSVFLMNSTGVPGSLIEPAEATQVATTTPLLRLNNVLDGEGDVATYEFEVYSDASLTTLVTSVSGVPEGSIQTSWTVDPALAEDGQFWWRSRSFDGYEYSVYSATGMFFVNAVNQAPAAFSLLDPVDSESGLGTYPRLTWQTAPDADPGDSVRYTLWTDIDPGFGAYTESADLPDTFRTLTYELTEGVTYFWKVQALDRSDSVTWSTETFSFTVGVLTCCVDRGNVDDLIGPGGAVDVTDVTYIVSYLFKGGPVPPCEDAANVDAIVGPGGPIDVADLTYLVAFLFKGGPPMASCL